jgi:VIT1/CCC1 family predicted Fe2+/Mn2+ transporter
MLIRLLGPRKIRTTLAAMKIRGLSVYSAAIASGAADAVAHNMPTSATSGAMERRHRGLSSGGNLRAAVFGINDGLVSNASLIMGVAGATMHAAQGSRGMILLSGFAGMLAGAFSMAAGEYVSVRSQREMYEYQIALEREELAEYPEEEAAELALIYEARGVEKNEARRVAAAMIADPEKGLDTLAREELGLNPEELGSPWGAATFSFVAFSIGAIIPLAPFLMIAGTGALYASIALTVLALFGVGSTLSLFTGRNALRGGLRMLCIGGGAGALTFLIGRLLGVNLS